MKLRDYLKAKSMSQAAFGRLLQPPVSQGKVNHWLSGTRRVSLAEALQIARVTAGSVQPADLVQVAQGCGSAQDVDGATTQTAELGSGCDGERAAGHESTVAAGQEAVHHHAGVGQ